MTPAAPPVIEEQPAQVDEEPEMDQEPEQPRASRTRQHARIESPAIDEEIDHRPIAVCKAQRKTAGAAPSEWWKARESTPAILSSDEEENVVDDDDSDYEDVEAANNLGEAELVTWEEAISGPHAEQWREAALDKIKGHHMNNTWDLIELPSGEKAIESKWVF